MIENDWDFKKIKDIKENALKELIYNNYNTKKYEFCPYCGFSYFIKYGKYKGIQRYQCKNKECNKTFSNTTLSVWKYLKHDPEKWFKFLELMGQHSTLKECSFKLQISIVTAFNWRHKIFHALENINKPEKFKEVAIIKTYCVEKCFKGSRNKHYTSKEKIHNKIEKMYGNVPTDVEVLIARDDKNLPLIKTTEPYERVKDNLENNVVYFSDKTCFIHVDGHINYDLKKYIINYNKKLPDKIRKKYGFKIKLNNNIEDNIVLDENLNTFIPLLAVWLSRFKGIATKYINHYYNFFAIIHSYKKFNYIDIFFDILKNSFYTSVDVMNRIHLENY